MRCCVGLSTWPWHRAAVLRSSEPRQGDTRIAPSVEGTAAVPGLGERLASLEVSGLYSSLLYVFRKRAARVSPRGVLAASRRTLQQPPRSRPGCCTSSTPSPSPPLRGSRLSTSHPWCPWGVSGALRPGRASNRGHGSRRYAPPIQWPGGTASCASSARALVSAARPARPATRGTGELRRVHSRMVRYDLFGGNRSTGRSSEEFGSRTDHPGQAPGQTISMKRRFGSSR